MNPNDSPTLFALANEIYGKGVQNDGNRDQFKVSFSPFGFDKVRAEKDSMSQFQFDRHSHQPTTIMGYPFDIASTQKEDFVVHTQSEERPLKPFQSSVRVRITGHI